MRIHTPPHNSLYQLVCGLQHHLREYGHADIKLLKSIFRSTPDGEMKQLNATGNYINKKEA